MSCRTWCDGAHRSSWRNSFEALRLHRRAFASASCRWRDIFHSRDDSAHPRTRPRESALAAGLLISVSAVHSQDNSKIPSSYMPVDIHESFSAIMNRMTAATILFPAFRKIVSEHEYDALGEEFEKKEAHHSTPMVLRRASTQ
jgi:hypothetical protein